MEKCHTLVSIIVPVYGTEAYLPACIESLCRQTYENIQIILVDDQSPDRCPEICDAYAEKDSRVIVIHQENKGVSGARNTGLCQADGDYILFVDSDDELYPDAVNILLEDAFAYHADMVWAPQKRVDKKGHADSTYEEGAYTVFGDDEPLLLSLNGAYNINAVWGKMFKADFIRGLCFEEGKNINEDGFFTFQCYLRKPTLVRHNASVYRYNTRADSCSRQTFSDKYLAVLYFCDKKKELLSGADYERYADAIHNMELRTYLQMLDLLCRSTDRRYKDLQRRCIQKVCELRAYHKPINPHHKQLEWIVCRGLYPLYKRAVWFKYYR